MGIFNDVYYSFSVQLYADYERENPYFKEAVKDCNYSNDCHQFDNHGKR